MTPHQAAAKWQARQQDILMQTYLKAWQTGAANYRGSTATPADAAGTGQQPARPQPAAMQRALQPALQSLARVTAGAVMIAPPTGVPLPTAIAAYLMHHAYRLAGGASVAWAAEQAGYAQAADADQQLLEWQLEASAHHCADCLGLAGLPPMPLNRWPTLPGEGATECNGGCKCSMRAVGQVAPVPLDGQQLQSLQRVAAKVPALIAV